MTRQPTPGGELRALTGARGIAAWWVVLFHLRLSLPWLPAGVAAVLAKGYLAVDFFFLLSGFVMWLSWGERLHDAGSWAGGWAGGRGGRRVVAGFWWKRIARVWPLHAAMLGYGGALALLMIATGHPDPAAFPLAAWPFHLLLVQDWGWLDPLNWNDPAWSISAEAAAYLLFPLLAAAVDWRRVPTVWLLAVLAAILLALHLAFAAVGAWSLGHDIRHFGVLRCCAEFAAGTVVCALWQRRPDGAVLPPLAIAAGSMTLATLGWLPETLAVPPAFAALLLALARSAGRRRHPLEGRAIHYLGTISYATYLGHFLLFFTVKLALVRDPHAIPPAIAALYLAVVLAGSVALHELVERPAQAWLTRGRRRPRPRHPGPVPG